MNLLKTINDLGNKAKIASAKIKLLKPKEKISAYENLESNLKINTKKILDANKLDIENAIHQYFLLILE